MGSESSFSINSNISSIGHTEIYASPNHSDSSMYSMYIHFLSGQLCDVTLLAGDMAIKTHRLVLSCASEYFSAMFNSDLVESHQEVITLAEVDGKALKKLTIYAYTGQIVLTEESVEHILKTASLLGFYEVVDACSSFLSKEIDSSNCIGIALLADSHSLLDLKDHAISFARENFLEVVQHEEFLELSHKDLVQLLLGSDEINVPSEMTVFNALMRWFNHDKANRQEHMPRLMKFIKFTMIEPISLIDNIMPQLGTEVRDSILEAMQYHLVPDRRGKICPFQLNPRKSTLDIIFAIGGTASVEESLEGYVNVEIYDPKIGSWKVYNNFPDRHGSRLQFAIASLKNLIFVAGGREFFKGMKCFDCYDVTTMKWEALPNMSTQRHGLGLAAIQPNGPIYAVGGHDGWCYLNSVERWDPEVSRWCYTMPMSCYRSTLGVTVFNNKIYAIGGRDGASCLRTVEVYDPHTNRWTNCAPMSRRRAGVGVAVLNGYIYALGGHDSIYSFPAPVAFSTVERYDPQKNAWNLIAEMNWTRLGIGTALLGNKILAAGGSNGFAYSNKVEVYDPVRNKWDEIANMNYPRAGACITSIRRNLVEGTESDEA